MKIADTISTLTKNAETIRNTDPQSASTMEPGDEFRQGDLRVIRLPNNFVATNRGNLEPIAKPSAQLAPGDTQGSRHILQRLDCCKFFRLKDGNTLDGAIVEMSDVNAITHPEHGDLVDIPAGCYAFPGQRAFAEELRRTAD